MARTKRASLPLNVPQHQDSERPANDDPDFSAGGHDRSSSSGGSSSSGSYDNAGGYQSTGTEPEASTAVRNPLPFVDLVDRALKNGEWVSSNCVVNLCHSRRINARRFHELHYDILGEDGWRWSNAGAIVIESKEKNKFYALGANHRTLIAGAMLGPLYVAPIPWIDVEAASRQRGLIQPNDEFELTDCILDALDHCIRSLESGDRGKGIVDQMEEFSANIAVNWDQAYLTKKRYNSKPPELSLPLNDYFPKIYGKAISLPDKKVYIHGKAGAIPDEMKIKIDNALTNLYDDNGSVVTFRKVYRGFVNLYNFPVIVELLETFNCPIKHTTTFLASIGNNTREQMKELQRLMTAVPPSQRLSFDLGKKLRIQTNTSSKYPVDETNPYRSVLLLMNGPKREKGEKEIAALITPLQKRIIELESQVNQLSKNVPDARTSSEPEHSDSDN